MYRKRNNCSKELANMRKARERLRMESDPPDYPAILPELRREIIVIDHDFGIVVEHIQLFKTNRVDSYRAVVDGRVWRERIGWAKILEGVRKSFLRVRAM